VTRDRRGFPWRHPRESGDLLTDWPGKRVPLSRE
jgi:hypothetical protein